MTKKKVLVTGGAGFIGSNLVDELIDRDNRVVVYDNFDEYYFGKENNLKQHEGKSDFILLRADVLDLNTISEAMKGVEVVFHLAAQSGVRFSMKNPTKTSNMNIIGTLNVLKAARESGVKKVVFASSSSVYGQPKYLPTDEGHVTSPISIYGASKLAAEKYCQIFNYQLGLPVVILRYHTVYGPRQRPDMAIYKWTKAIFEGKPLSIYGDGRQTRDFTFVGDVINGTIKAVEAEDVNGEIFNLGGGNTIRINDVVRLLINILGVSDIKVIHEPPKLGDVRDTYADIAKARKMLGYNPAINIKDGLQRFTEWYRNNSLLASS